nr:hypothetical protein [Tanacetum cinerariifolium]
MVRSASSKTIFVSLRVGSLSFFQIEKGIRLMLAPRSARARQLSNPVKSQGIRKRPRSPSFYELLKHRRELWHVYECIGKTELKINLIADAASSLGEDGWELNVRSIPTSSAVFPLPVMCSHCQKKFPLVVQNSSHC